MTSKAVLSQLEVNERRLKGIYDQLECGNFKKAIFEAEKVLKKNSNLLPAKVLKGLALFRIGKSIEAYSLIDEVAKLTPTDENTLNSLSYFYKESNQKNKIVEIYEEAYKKCPNREDICANLFYCHTKNFDFLSQQKVATQLKKINANHMEYVIWPMISNVLYGVYNNDERLIKLGEAILARYLKSNPLLTMQIVDFFMFTLEKLNKLEDCLDWLNGPVLKDVVENNQNKELFTRYKISVLLKLNKKVETCDLFWQLLEENLDDVCLWRDYIDVIVILNLPNDDAHSVSRVIDKLNSSYQKPTMSIKIAKIHLGLKIRASNNCQLLSLEFGSIVDHIVEYFLEFGDKPCSLYDTYSFLTINEISTEERLIIVDRLSEITGSLCKENISNVKDIERHVTLETLKRAINGNITTNNDSDHQMENKAEKNTDTQNDDYHLDDPEKICRYRRLQVVEIPQLVSLYDHSLQFCQHISSECELKPCDHFVRLAVNRYHDNWLAQKSNCKPLIDSMTLLKRTIDQSPANYHLRLQMSNLLGQLQCADLMIDQFKEMEIKQLMWDSIGHVFIVPMLSTPSFQQRAQFFKRNVERKLKNKLEIEDSLVTCYKLANYSKIPEIIDFHRDIDASVMSRLSEVEIFYINTVLKCNNCDELFECFSAIPEFPEVIDKSDPELDILQQFSHLKDFRDLNTSPCFNQFDRIWTEEHQRLSFQNILYWLCQRVVVIRSFYAAAKLTMETVVKLDRLVSDSSNVVSFASTETSSHYRTLRSCSDQLIDIWNKMATLTGSYDQLSSCTLTGCPEPPQNSFSPLYMETVKGCMSSILLFHDLLVRRSGIVEGGNQLDNFISTIGAPLKLLVDEIVANEIKIVNGNGDGSDDMNNLLFVLMPTILSKITAACELLSFVTLTLAVMETMTKPLRRKMVVKRRNKKKKADCHCSNEHHSDDTINRNGEELKSFLDCTNFHQLPQFFIDIACQLQRFMVDTKKSIISAQNAKLINVDILFNVSDSWKTSFDDAINFVNVKKLSLTGVKKIFQDDFLSHGSGQVNNDSIVVEHGQ